LGGGGCAVIHASSHSALAFGMTLEQIVHQCPRHFKLTGLACSAQMKIERHGMQDFIGRRAGIGDVDGFDAVWQMRQDHIAQQGLATAEFAADFDETIAVG